MRALERPLSLLLRIDFTRFEDPTRLLMSSTLAERCFEQI